MIDATNEFLRIAKDLALSEAEAKKIQGLAVLRAKAELIERNKATGVYEDNLTLQSKDEQEFWELVAEYGIKPDAAREIRNFVKERYVQSPWYRPVTEFLLTATVGALIGDAIISPALILVYGWVKKRRKEKIRRTRGRKFA